MQLKYIAYTILPLLLLTGCGKNEQISDSSDRQPRDNTPVVNQPLADGEITYGNELVTIDASHTEDGYIMAKYLGDAGKIKLQLTGEDTITYTYDLAPGSDYDTFPLSSGDGDYMLEVFENIQDDKYATAYSDILSVTLKDEFTPFLYPNQFVNYTDDTQAVQEGATLADGADSDLDVVTNIYNFVTDTVTYDDEKALTVTTGYLPDIDATLTSKTGICFDYAALMACMLRTQRIPTKLQIGYAGDVYHAWISTYLNEVGWVDNIIQFDGYDWTMLDPTFASSAKDDPSINDFIKEASNYTVKYSR